MKRGCAVTALLYVNDSYWSVNVFATLSYWSIYFLTLIILFPVCKPNSFGSYNFFHPFTYVIKYLYASPWRCNFFNREVPFDVPFKTKLSWQLWSSFSEIHIIPSTSFSKIIFSLSSLSLSLLSRFLSLIYLYTCVNK